MKSTIQLILIFMLILFSMNSSAVENLSVGELAPDFTLQDQKNKSQTLSEMKGKWMVLYFYPKNETPGCVAEACSFRDNIVAIKSKNTIVWGLSVDNKESNAEFAKNHQLPFTLLADRKGEVAEKYHALINVVAFKMAKRHSFIINPQGRIAKIYRRVNPDTHVEEILEDLKKVQSNTTALK